MVCNEREKSVTVCIIIDMQAYEQMLPNMHKKHTFTVRTRMHTNCRGPLWPVLDRSAKLFIQN